MKDEALKVANRLQDVIIYLSEMDNVPTEITDRILQAGLTICLLATSPRELSNEEILEYVYAFSEQRCSIYSFQEDNILEMIRAILKKASEK